MTDFVKMRELIKQEERWRWAVERAEARATGSPIRMSKAGKSRTNKVGSQVEEGAVELAELRLQHSEIKEELEAMRKELQQSIRKLRGPKYQLDKSCLRMRYMKGISVRKIAYSLNYSEDYIFQKMKQAERIICTMQREKESVET